MAEIVNLRLARKRKARADREQSAAENRARFGRAKADRKAEEATKALEARKLEGHRRAPHEPED